MPPETKIYINGVNGVTGQYLVRPRTSAQLASFVTGETDQSLLKWFKRFWAILSIPHFGIEPNWKDIREAGWGIVFHQAESDEVKQALEPLIQHRRNQVDNDLLVKVLEYHPGETVKEFLGRYKVAPGGKDPWKVPYYLLLVGSPEHIPFNFGHLLDIEYAIGRLHFDKLADYEAYAASMITYESNQEIPNAREAVFWGTRHKFDQATNLSAEQLVTPLINGIPTSANQPAKPGVGQDMNFQIKKYLEADATKDALVKVFDPPTGSKPPAFLFTASHGVGWPKGHPDQHAKQGALLCQDWPGIGKINAGHYFSASDLPDNARMQGLISFHFACYGAGTPARDRFMHKPGKTPPAIAPNSFIANLPKALLSHPNGGALAVIGHVERAWGYSITTAEAGMQILPFYRSIERILNGLPVGYAIKDFNEKFTFLSSNLTDLLEKKSFGEVIPDEELATCWIERNDSEGYVVIGDPAVHLRVADLA